MNNDKQLQQYNETYARAKARWDCIAKPIDSLGLLEEHVCKLCAIAGDTAPYNPDKRALVVLCADHGVVCEGVTQTGSGVTRVVAENFANQKSSVNYMARVAGVDVFAVDIGMLGNTYPEKQIVQGAVIDRKVDTGTKNLAIEAAMTISRCEQAIAVGREIVRELKKQGYKIILTGEMGIGNTTPSSVLAALLLEKSPEAVTGRGAGLDDKGLTIKRQVVARAIARIKEKQVKTPIQMLAEAGGYEIAGMAGMFLGGVEEQMPIVIDGVISAVAALVATAMDERVPRYAFASHVSEEPVGRLVLQALRLPAIIHGKLCLGEGSGAVALLPLLDMGLSVYHNMGTFDDLCIEAYDRVGKPVTKPTAEPLTKPASVQFETVLPHEIEKKSFSILTEELGDTELDPMQAPIIKRCIHTSADFDYLNNLCFSGHVVEKLHKAIKNGACIVTDTQMAKAGINKRELAKYGGEVFCFMSDEDVALAAKERGCTRATVSMEKAAGLGKPIIFAIGNAPTALICLHELITTGKIRPEGIIGVPVGFVNVVEAKELIMTADVPYIVARGRKGGSNVAAAICNALLYQIRDLEK